MCVVVTLNVCKVFWVVFRQLLRYSGWLLGCFLGVLGGSYAIAKVFWVVARVFWVFARAFLGDWFSGGLLK